MKPLNSMAGLCAAIFLQACDSDTVAGTNNETHTKGTFYQANGKPAVGARVRVYSAAQKETDSTTTQVAQDYVDANGNVALKLKPGHYSLVADSDSISAFIDSVFSDGDKVAIPVDTLRPTGTITGYVRVQPMHSPSIAWVHLMRTNLYTKVDSTGFFRLTNVPAGSLDLVAVSHLPEYTPTHKLVRAQPDSTVHVDTIDLVYNGLPLVTEIAATYDPLSGVVTLTWHDTAYARKMGYLVYRQTGSTAAIPPSALAFTTPPVYLDTVFGGFGSKPSRLDSAEFDLSYWIAAKGTDQKSISPMWNKVNIHVKSPALSRFWTVTMDSIPDGFSGITADRMDTTESGLLLLNGAEGDATFTGYPQSTLLRSDLQWDPTIRHDSSELWYNRSVFWKGRVWQCAGYAPSDSIETMTVDNSGTTHSKRSPIYDSVLLRSSSDGAIWDSIHLAIGKDSVTNFQFRPHPERLEILLMSDFGMITGFRSPIAIQGKLTTSDGTTWRGDIFDLSAPGEFLRVWINQLHYRRLIGPIGDVWTEASRLSMKYRVGFEGSALWQQDSPDGWLIPGEDIDTSHAILRTKDNLRVRSRSDLLAVGSLLIDEVDSRHQSVYREIALVSPQAPIFQQRIPLPEPILDFCFWQEKLVMLAENRRIYIATISKIK